MCAYRVCFRVTTGAAALISSCCLTGPALAVDSNREPPAPTDVRIISAPEPSTERDLAYATWALALGTGVLCAITFHGLRKQGRDMEASIRIAGLTADAAGRAADAANLSAQLAARQWRDALERETNVAAHRVSVTATRVVQLAASVPVAQTQLSILAGQLGVGQHVDQANAKATERSRRAAEIRDVAGLTLESQFANASDGELAAKLRRFDEFVVQLEATKEEISGELTALEAESRARREQMTAMQAAALTGNLARPPKTTLGS